MSFTGALEYLPIVDVLQLLHASRKSGLLRIRGRRGESQLIFKEGYIVSASHLDNSVRIGQVLTEMGIITPEALEKGLQEQARAGEDRRPLIVTLVEMGLAREEDAYRGLEHLIELTIVEILRWKRGTFILEARPAPAADQYRYYPERIAREISVDTQGALMEALRIYDEKMRDGLLPEESEEDETEAPASQMHDTHPLLSADDLGLGDLDQIDTRPRPLFASLNDEDPLKLQQQRLKELAPQLADASLQRLAAFLLTKGDSPVPSGTLPALIIFSQDELLCHSLTTFCSHSGMFVCSVAEGSQLASVTKRCSILNSVPLILFDTPDGGNSAFAAERELAVAHIRKHPGQGTPLLQLAAAGDRELMLQAYAQGFRSVIPRPDTRLAGDGDVEELMRFLLCVQGLLARCIGERANDALPRLKGALTRFLEIPTPQGVASSLLQQVAELCQRSLTLVVQGDKLIAEKGIGVTAERSAGMVAAPAFRIPVTTGSLLQRVVDEGRVVSGPLDDPALPAHLFSAIGAPRTSAGMLLPVRRRGRTLAVIYGDFGTMDAPAVNGDLPDLLAALASLVLDKTGRSGG
jgi:hypothetical protein